MKIYYSNSRIESATGAALGNFDGVHKGHMKLIDALIKDCSDRKLVPAVHTFIKHPEHILREGFFLPILTTSKKKTEILKDAGVQILYFDEFDENYSRQSPEEFIKNVLLEKLNLKLAIVGEDYRFGYKAEGDAETLKKAGTKYGFEVKVIPPQTIHGKTVSSTYIRQLLSSGNVEEASEFLGRRFSISGKVVHGENRGNQLGFPTANIIPDSDLAVPSMGVYITLTKISGKIFESISNVGIRPTFGNKTTNVETHIFNFNEKIYGQEIEVFFVSKIRDEIRFESKEELILQIRKDIDHAVAYLKKLTQI